MAGLAIAAALCACGSRPSPAGPAAGGPRGEIVPTDTGPVIWLDDSTMLEVVEPDFAPLGRRVRVRRLTRGALAAAVAPGRRALFLVRGYGGTLVHDGRRSRIRSRHVVEARFSPGGHHLALAEERRRISIVSVARRAVVARVEDAAEPRWVDDDVLEFRRRCQPWRLRVGQTARRVGDAPCGRVIHRDAGRRRWFVADEEGLRGGVIPTFTRLSRVDLDDGEVEVLLEASRETPFMTPRVSPSGDRWCYLDHDFALLCTHAGEPRRVWPRGVRRPIRFSDDGSRLLFAVRGTGRANDDVYVVDFEELVVTRIPRDGRRRWEFLPGGRGLVGHGDHHRLLVYDLEERWRAEVGFGRSEWEGLWLVPGEPRRFLAGHERGGTRDVYSVALPASTD